MMTFSLNDFLSCVPVLSHSSLKSLLGKAVRNDDGVFGSSAGESGLQRPNFSHRMVTCFVCSWLFVEP